MSQADLSIADQPGSSFLSELNTQLQALGSRMSGASAPATTYAYMTWADTTTGTVKQRNAANSGWIVRGTLDETFLLSRSSNTKLDVSDFSKMIRATAGYTQTFDPCASLTDGWFVDYRIESGATIVFDPDSSEQIDGGATKSVSGPSSGTIFCNGSALYTSGFVSSVAAAGLTSSAISAGATMINGTIAHSRAANAETIAIKTLAGADPSAADPVLVIFRSVTAATGNYTVLSLTAATSLTLSSGSTLGAVSGQPFRLWFAGFNDGGTFRLAAINCLAGSDAAGWSLLALTASGIGSATAEGGAGAADSTQVPYAAAAVSGKAYTLLGYSSWDAGLATAGTWNTAPSAVQLFGPGILLPGSQLSFTRTRTTGAVACTTQIPVDNTKPQLTEGDQILTVSTYPLSPCNLFRVRAVAQLTASGLLGASVAIFRDSGADALTAAAVTITASGYGLRADLEAMVLAASVATTTFTVRAGPNAAGTVYLNAVAGGGGLFNGVSHSGIEVIEIQG